MGRKLKVAVIQMDAVFVPVTKRLNRAVAAKLSAPNNAWTTQVGSYPLGASPYGLMDMAGSVWEWVADWYDSGYYSVSPYSNPPGPSTGDYRLRRGGYWRTNWPYARAAMRLENWPDDMPR